MWYRLGSDANIYISLYCWLVHKNNQVVQHPWFQKRLVVNIHYLHASLGTSKAPRSIKWLKPGVYGSKENAPTRLPLSSSVGYIGCIHLHIGLRVNTTLCRVYGVYSIVVHGLTDRPEPQIWTNPPPYLHPPCPWTRFPGTDTFIREKFRGYMLKKDFTRSTYHGSARQTESSLDKGAEVPWLSVIYTIFGYPFLRSRRPPSLPSRNERMSYRARFGCIGRRNPQGHSQQSVLPLCFVCSLLTHVDVGGSSCCQKKKSLPCKSIHYPPMHTSSTCAAWLLWPIFHLFSWVLLAKLVTYTRTHKIV